MIIIIINHWIIHTHTHTPNFFKERLLLIWLEFKKQTKTKKIHIWHKSLDIFYFFFISVYQQESEEKTISSNGSCLSLCPQHVHRLQKHESSQIVEQDATNDNDLKLWIYIEWIVWIHYLYRYIQKIENEEMEILLVKKKMIELSPKGIYIKFLF